MKFTLTSCTYKNIFYFFCNVSSKLFMLSRIVRFSFRKTLQKLAEFQRAMSIALASGIMGKKKILLRGK